MDNTVKEPLIHLSKREGYAIWKEMAGKNCCNFPFTCCMRRFYFYDY